MDTELLQTVEDGFETVARELEAVHLRAALGEAMRLAGEVNRYLDQTAPGRRLKPTARRLHAPFTWRCAPSTRLR